MKKPLLVQALLLTLSVLFVPAHTNATHTVIEVGHTIKLKNNTFDPQTIEIYTRENKGKIKFWKYEKLQPNHYVDLQLSQEEDVLFRIRTLTKDCQVVVDNGESYNEVSVTQIVSQAKDRWYFPGERVIPFLWEQEKLQNEKLEKHEIYDI